MERRSFLTLLPLMPMAGKLMVTMPRKYLSPDDLGKALDRFDFQKLVDNIFTEDPMFGYLRVLAETPGGSQYVEEWHYAPEDACELGKDGPG